MKADLGDEIPEALQEGVDLGLDGRGHAVPCHQVHILPLVLLCHPAPVHTTAVSHRKKRKDYAFWRQFNEKPRIIRGCPGTVSLKLSYQKLSSVSQHSSNLPPKWRSWNPNQYVLHMHMQIFRVFVHTTCPVSAFACACTDTGQVVCREKYGTNIATQSFCTCRAQGM